jgi:hypothetical protein
MKRTLAIALGLALCTTAQAEPITAAPAQRIEIKGLYIGMTYADIKKTLGTLPLRDFTIAGAHAKAACRDCAVVSLGNQIKLHKEGSPESSCTSVVMPSVPGGHPTLMTANPLLRTTIRWTLFTSDSVLARSTRLRRR